MGMTKKEYEERFARNQLIFGSGFGTSVSLPCPFCAAPDNLKYRVIDSEAAMTRGASQECGRSWKAIFTAIDGGKQFEIVQTAGDDPPDFLPAMRRAP
jgi:hypothetical protein